MASTYDVTIKLLLNPPPKRPKYYTSTPLAKHTPSYSKCANVLDAYNVDHNR